MTSAFTKRIYTWAAFNSAVRVVFGSMDDLRRAARTRQPGFC